MIRRARQYQSLTVAKMRSFKLVITLLIASLWLAPLVVAQSETQNVTVVVQEINEITVSAATLTITINSATAGSAPDDATDLTTTYNITSNGANKKITGQLDVDYAAGISLAIELTEPAGATSAGEVTLTSGSASDLVTGITRVTGMALQIKYTAAATAAAVPNEPAGETHTVTLTITNI